MIAFKFGIIDELPKSCSDCRLWQAAAHKCKVGDYQAPDNCALIEKP
jgi:hypothetical protein